MKSFSERNPIIIATVGLLLIALITGLAYFSDRLPVIGRGESYSAYFTEAAGLKVGNEVRIAGVKVGTVRDVAVEDDLVLVGFDLQDDAWVGDQTSASIRIRTALGQKYVALDPVGSREMAPGTAIPASRTTSPFDVQQALAGLTTRTEQIDTDQLAASFTALSDAFENTPDSVRASLQGLTALSKTISSRDEELAQLVAGTSQLTKTLDDRTPQIEALIQDGNLLLAELQRRRQAVSDLLDGTRALSTQVQGLVADNQAQLGPALEKLRLVTVILDRNQRNLQQALTLAAPYYSLLTDATGTGHWLDSYICGLFDAAGNPVLDADATRTCDPGGAK